MNKTILRTICLIICVLCCATTVFGNNIVESNYFAFRESVNRMNSDGTFDFGVTIRVQSDTFTADKVYVTIATYAHVYNLVTRSEFTSTSEDYKYKVSLYKDGLVDTFVGSYTGYADGNRAGKSLDTTKGSKYYFVISAVNENLSMTPYSIEGTGSVDHVTVD